MSSALAAGEPSLSTIVYHERSYITHTKHLSRYVCVIGGIEDCFADRLTHRKSVRRRDNMARYGLRVSRLPRVKGRRGGC